MKDVRWSCLVFFALLAWSPLPWASEVAPASADATATTAGQNHSDDAGKALSSKTQPQSLGSAYDVSMRTALKMPDAWFACRTDEDCTIDHVPCNTGLAVAKQFKDKVQALICNGECIEDCLKSALDTSQATCRNNECQTTIETYDPRGKTGSNSSVVPGSGTGGITVTGVTETTTYNYQPLIVTAINGMPTRTATTQVPYDEKTPGPGDHFVSAIKDPLMLAVRSNNKTAALQALDSGANPNMVDKDGFTPLMYAVMYGFADHDIIQALLDYGADVNARSNNGDDALLVGIGDSGGVKPEFIEQLLRAHADPNLGNTFGRTPLMDAVDHPDDFRLLLQYGADPNAKSAYDGSSVFLQAVAANKSDLVRQLLAHGANINGTRDSDGKNAIQIATEGGNGELSKYLEASGAVLPPKGEWPLFENATFGYTVAHPPDSTVKNDDSASPGNSLSHPLNSSPSIAIVLPVQYSTDQGAPEPVLVKDDFSVRIHAEGNLQNLTLEQWVAHYYKTSRIPVTQSAVSWRGKPAIEVQPPSMLGAELCIFSGTTIIYGICRNDLSKETQPELLAEEPILEKIVDSFQPRTEASSQSEPQQEALTDYTDCGCGCCGGSAPSDKCLYKRDGDSLERLVQGLRDHPTTSQNLCALTGCSKGVRYHYCD